MDNAVALVQTYLRVNGYFTVTEHPVIVPAPAGAYKAATDLDILAMRFPGAGRIVPARRVGADEEHTVVDSALAIGSDQADMLIGEVKEGRAIVNPATRDRAVLRAVLITFGCCSREKAPSLAETLLRDGHALLPNGHRVRMAAFGSLTDGSDSSRYLVISLGHIVRYLKEYVNEHWEMLRHADSKDPAFGFLVTLAKAERGDK